VPAERAVQIAGGRVGIPPPAAVAREATTKTPNPLPPATVMTVTTATTQMRTVGLQQAQVRHVVAGCRRQTDRSQGRLSCAACESACSLRSGLA
jgi:hypothetical protein